MGDDLPTPHGHDAMRNGILISLCFIAGLAGANVQPILTGAGKLIFPETTPSATISAASGALTVAAGGSNQSVVVKPSGTGAVNAGGYLSFGGLFAPLNGGHLRGDAQSWASLFNTTLAIEDTDAAAGGANGFRPSRLMNRRNTSLWTHNATTTDGTNWNLDQTG